MEQNQIPTIGNFLVVQLIMCIPLVGLVMMIIWAIGGDGAPQWRCNYARAYLILSAIGIVLSIIFFGTITAIVASLVGSVIGG